MLKLVSPSARRRSTRPRAKRGDTVRQFQTQIEHGRGVGQSAQRAVARARRTVIDLQCGVRRGVSRGVGSDTIPLHALRLAEIATRLEDIHQRLLLFSTSIELEMDRLDVVQAELEALASQPQTEHRR